MLTVESVVVAFCLILVIKLFILLIKSLYYNIIAPNIGLTTDLTKMGKWVVITGATDGLGKGYAEVLAEKGMNIVLVSRSQEKLKDVASYLESTYKVQTRTVQVDFTDTEEVYHTIDKQLIGLEVGVLINNVGMSYSYPEYFLDVNDKEKLYPNIIRCNVTSVIKMCEVVMPKMVERRKGVIINVSSTAAEIASPLLSIYSASKAFVDKFSADLRTEYTKHGIIVQCVLPGYVSTKMSKIKSPTWMAPTPIDYVKSALRLVGIQDHTKGYFPHSLLVGVIIFFRSISPALEKWLVVRTMENIRARALRRCVQ